MRHDVVTMGMEEDDDGSASAESTLSALDRLVPGGSPPPPPEPSEEGRSDADDDDADTNVFRTLGSGAGACFMCKKRRRLRHQSSCLFFLLGKIVAFFLYSPHTILPSLPPYIAVVREVLVELEPPDNIALAKIEVDSASTRAVQATIFPPLGIVFEENGEGDIVVKEAWGGLELIHKPLSSKRIHFHDVHTHANECYFRRCIEGGFSCDIYRW